MTREIKSVGVIGLGTMGAGIVEVFARAGVAVVAVDGTVELAERGRGFLTGSLDRQVSKGRLEQTQRDEIVGRATFSASLTDLKDVDLVIEAVPERMEIKTSIFTQLDGIVREDCVLATNTSSLSITAIAAATKHPQRVIGMHFFNPAPILALVEVITTLLVDESLVTAVRDLSLKLGKKPVVVRDRAGFVANALLITYLARAIRTYETGHVSREDLDDAGRIGIGFPMGPLTLSDLIGLDVVKEVCDVLYAATKDPSAAPPALLEQMVAAGRLGRKTGHGFYAYEKPGSGAVADPAAERDFGSAAANVVLLGDGPVADAAAQALGPVTRFGADQAAAVTLKGADLVVVALGEPDGDVEAESWITPAIRQLDGSTVVAATDPFSRYAATVDLDDDVEIVEIDIHAATKAGQVAEVVRALHSDDAAVDTVHATLRAAGLRTLHSRDRAGRIVDALLLPHLNDAVKMLDSGYATTSDIDTAMTAGCGYPQGPFAYIDQIGVEETLMGIAALYDENPEPALAPSPLFVDHLAADRSFLEG
ncbi:3-hydroxybutyryl-CoA dehydrogenase [Calidifontibacter terrae]